MIKYKPKSVNVHETGEDYRIILEYEKPLFKNIDVFERELRGQHLGDPVMMRKGGKTIRVIRKLPKNTDPDYVKVYQGDPNTLIAYESYDNKYDVVKAVKTLNDTFPHYHWEVKTEEYEYNVYQGKLSMPRGIIKKRYYIVGKLKMQDNRIIYDKVKRTYNNGTEEDMMLLLEDISNMEAKELLKTIMSDLYKKHK